MAGFTAKAWCSEPLLEWTPEKLPGYAEAIAASERGESLFPPARVKAAPHPRRSIESLTAERDELVARRDRFNAAGPVDTAAARLNPAGMRAHYRNTDNELAEYSRLTGRIEALDYKIRRATR